LQSMRAQFSTNATNDNAQAGGFWPGPLDCTQPVAPGMYGALHHVLLASELLWKPASDSISPIISTLQRLYAEVPPPTPTHSQLRYLEPDIAAAVLLPHGIKAVIGVFSMLFGTPGGELLQQWCIDNGWALLWSPGFRCADGFSAEYCTDVQRGKNTDGSSKFQGLASRALTSGVQRIVDPVVQNKTSNPVNVSVTRATLRNFLHSWDTVANHVWDAVASQLRGMSHKTRTLAPTMVMSPSWWGHWSRLVLRLPPQFRVRAVKAYQCGAIARCVGVTWAPNSRHDMGDCVCYQRPLAPNQP
jgi:hypothetical protein